MSQMQERLSWLIGESRSGFIKDITIWACCPLYGWLPIRFSLDSETFLIRFSDVYPPVEDFKNWITAIIQNNVSEPLKLFDEDDEHFFHVSPLADEKEDLLLFEYLHYSFSNTGSYHKSIVKKDKLILELYCVLEFLMAIDFEEEEELHSPFWFKFDYHSDDIIKFDLSEIRRYLIDSGTLPGTL